MTPKNSTYFPAYGASYADLTVEKSVQRSGSGNARADETSSGNDDINLQLLAENIITDLSLKEDCRSFLDASHTACSVDPVLSIPTRRDLLATTNLQSRCVSDQSADDESPRCTSPVAKGDTTYQDQQLFDGATRLKAEAAAETKEINIDVDGARLFRGRPDARLEQLIRCFKKSYSAMEKELWEQLEEEKLWTGSSATTKSDRPTRIRDHQLVSTAEVLAGLRCSYLALDKKVQDSCTLIQQLSKERTKEAGLQAAESAVMMDCPHYVRRCIVQFSCCRAYYPCHQCHNNSGHCANTTAEAKHATHLKCSVCNNEQEVNEDSHHCSACQTEFAEYFCAKCKHFSSANKNPYHCGKCGVCRTYRNNSFHCDVCNVCMDIINLGTHRCRPNSGHDICSICQEDTFSGCHFLPCSHKIHQDCMKAMVNNGTRSCPVCRHPLYTSIR